MHGVGGNIAALSCLPQFLAVMFFIAQNVCLQLIGMRKSKLDYCICGNGPVTNERGLPLATLHWVKASPERAMFKR